MWNHWVFRPYVSGISTPLYPPTHVGHDVLSKLGELFIVKLWQILLDDISIPGVSRFRFFMYQIFILGLLTVWSLCFCIICSPYDLIYTCTLLVVSVGSNVSIPVVARSSHISILLLEVGSNISSLYRMGIKDITYSVHEYILLIGIRFLLKLSQVICGLIPLFG